MNVIRSKDEKIDLRASLAEEWEENRRKQERIEAERNRLVVCEICNKKFPAYIAANDAPTHPTEERETE